MTARSSVHLGQGTRMTSLLQKAGMKTRRARRLLLPKLELPPQLLQPLKGGKTGPSVRIYSHSGSRTVWRKPAGPLVLVLRSMRKLRTAGIAEAGAKILPEGEQASEPKRTAAGPQGSWPAWPFLCPSLTPSSEALHTLHLYAPHEDLSPGPPLSQPLRSRQLSPTAP